MKLVPRKYLIDEFFDDYMLEDQNELKCDIYEKDGNYHIELDAPGIKKEDMSLEYDKGYLTISISQKEETEDKDKNYIRRERMSRHYSRKFYIGDIDPDKIEAKLENGSIKIKTPKEEKEATKKVIDIK